MYEVTEFIVQPPSGSAVLYRDERQARSEARRLSRRGPVMLFSVKGWPRYDLWDRPRLIGRYGSSAEDPNKPAS